MDLCYAMDLFLSTIDVGVCVSVIWVKSECVFAEREGSLCPVYVS